MPPIVALLFGYAVVFWLFRMDIKQRTLPSKAMWVPMLWLAIISSKPVSFWLGRIGLQSGGSSNLEGNSIDLVAYLVLIVAAAVILQRRHFSWGGFAARNKILLLLYAYLALTALWSEHTFPTVKRIFKDFGAVLVILVVLTEQNPMEAIRIAFVRLAYIAFPLSIVFIKYYPAIGRITGRTGDNMYSGVAWHKTSLGEVVFLYSIFIVLDMLEIKKEGGPVQASAKWIRVGLLLMGAWLVRTCGSATAVLCFGLGLFLFWGTGRLVRLRNPVRMIVQCAAVFLVAFTLEKALDLSGMVFQALGKDKSLTGRTTIWEMSTEANPNPLLGTGYYSFWSTESAKHIQQFFAGVMNSAHNGFLDMYLDGGMVGLVLLLALMLVWGGRSITRMLRGTLFGRVAFMVWILAIVFNHSETAFFRLLPMWFTLLLMMIKCPPPFDRAEYPDPEENGEEDEAAEAESELITAGSNSRPQESLA